VSIAGFVLGVKGGAPVGPGSLPVGGSFVHRRFGYDLAEVLAWVDSLPGPQTAAYEAGPTGFGLFRLLTGSGIECVVAAPSKLQRPSGDRVKTDLLTGTRSIWHACSSWARSRSCMSRRSPKKPPGIWSVPARTPDKI